MRPPRQPGWSDWHAQLVYGDKRMVQVSTDSRWLASDQSPSQADAGNAWTAALELGPLGMVPWGDVQASAGAVDTIPDVNILCRLLGQLGVSPDFQAQTKHAEKGLRFIHRRIGTTEVYFVANKNPHPEESLCSFRVSGQRPEFWWPESGRIEPAVIYDESGGVTRVPIQFESQGSVFVVFRANSTTTAPRSGMISTTFPSP